ncbi:hypothetical protein K1Y38_05660 [Serratia marcescens]|nr:hypothetical protein [Serratia marcescens]
MGRYSAVLSRVLGHFGDRHQRRRLSACHRIAIPDFKARHTAGYFLSLAYKKRYKTARPVQKTA